MRIVTKQEFYKLPSGTLYSEYKPCIFIGLKIKNDTIFDGDEPIDFFYEDLIGNVDANSFDDFLNMLNKSQKEKTEFKLDFKCSERDGLFEDDTFYAVYNTDEILALSNKIASCKGWELNSL